MFMLLIRRLAPAVLGALCAGAGAQAPGTEAPTDADQPLVINGCPI